MYAYAPTGIQIASTIEILPGTCSLSADAFDRDRHGSIDFDYDGSGTIVGWNDQTQKVVAGQRMFLDANGVEWPECSIILVENEIDPESDREADRALPTDLVEIARTAHERWSATRIRSISAPLGEVREESGESDPDDEETLLSPIATTLALLSGRSLNEIVADPSIARAFSSNARAIVASSGGTVAELVNAATLFPENVPLPTIVDGVEVVDMGGAASVALVSIQDIEWDDDGDGEDLPTSIVAAVDGHWSDDNGVVDSLSDHYGFCVSGVGSVEQIDRMGRPVEYDVDPSTSES